MRGLFVVALASSLLACSLITSLDGYSSSKGEQPSEVSIDGGGADTAEDAGADRAAVESAAPATHYLFVVGGLDGAQNIPQRETFLARVGPGGALDEWQAGPLLPSPRAEGALAIVGSSIFYLGGMDMDGTSMSTVFRTRFHAGVLDPWTNANPSPVGAARISAYGRGGGIFFVGGLQSPPYSTIYRSSVGDLLGPWSAVPSLPDGIANAALTMTDEAVYVIGGQHGDTDASAGRLVYVGRPDDAGTVATWQAASPLPDPATAGAAASTTTNVYFNGGYVRNGRIVFVAPVLAGGALGEWSQTNPASHERAGHGVLVAEGHLYLVAGQEGSTAISDVEVADIADGGPLSTFRFDRALPLPRFFFASATLTGD